MQNLIYMFRWKVVTRQVLISWRTSVMGRRLQHILFFPCIWMCCKCSSILMSLMCAILWGQKQSSTSWVCLVVTKRSDSSHEYTFRVYRYFLLHIGELTTKVPLKTFGYTPCSHCENNHPFHVWHGQCPETVCRRHQEAGMSMCIMYFTHLPTTPACLRLNINIEISCVVYTPA